MPSFGDIASLPYMVAFYAVWIVSSLIRPLIVATLLCLLINPSAARAKVQLFVNTAKHLALSKDKKWKKHEADPASFFSDDDNDDSVDTKTVIFLRHGESTWNDTFNQGDRSTGKFLMGFLPNLLKAACTEWYFFVTGKSQESWFYDSPLSEKGMSQAEGLRKYLEETDPQFSTPKEARLIRILRGESEEACRMTSSNLRRAISTICIGLRRRLDLKKKDDKIVILQELQEVSFNPDALSIHPAKGPLVDSWIDSDRTKQIYQEQCDTSRNKGNKDLSSNGMQRLEGFCQLAFDDELMKDVPCMVATGHSYWFRAFFQTYLPRDFEHVCKKKKLINGGVAGFTLKRRKVGHDGEYKYLVDPSSIVVLYGGF